jgi:thioredoxin reductase (NADPH)
LSVQRRGSDVEACRKSYSICDIAGADRLEQIDLTNRETGMTETMSAAGLFLFIGAQPHTEFLGDIITRNETGFILTGPDLVVNGERPSGRAVGH